MRSKFIGLVGLTALTLSSACAAPRPDARHAQAPAAPATTPAAATCSPAAFDALTVQRKASPSMVRIAMERGSGSGFVIGVGGDQLVVTNYHVVVGADAHFAELRGAGDRVRRIELEVVKFDVENDLALLRPTAELGVPGLELRGSPAELGEAVAALGYPYVAGSDFELTFEPGNITAETRRLDGVERVQTNANINPGNSGGPMLDGCGRVVGVVSAVHRMTARVGLAVPAKALETLVSAYRAPRAPAETLVEERLVALFREIRFKRSELAADYFGREFLSRYVAPEMQRLAQQAKDKARAYGDELRQRGLDPQKEPADELVKRFSNAEFLAFQTLIAAEKAKLDPYTAARKFLARTVAHTFGVVDEAQIEKLAPSKSGCMDAYVSLRGGGETRRYVVHLHHRWGEWVIDSIQRAR